MNKDYKIINKVVDETIDTIVDQLDQTLIDYMYVYGGYTESDDEFALDHEYLTKEVIKELYSRVKNHTK